MSHFNPKNLRGSTNKVSVLLKILKIFQPNFCLLRDFYGFLVKENLT